MSGLLKILGAIAPPPSQPGARDYDGWEVRWKMFTFRPALFKMEAMIFGAIALYLGWYFIGKFINTSRAKSALKPYMGLIQSQFKLTRPMLSSGPALHLLYSTGRRNVLCMHTTITLTPIHDLMALFTHFGKALIEPTHDSSEMMIFDILLGRGESGLQGEALGVWGIVSKSSMRGTRDSRWDLTFPRIHESASVPMTHALFAEHSDISDLVMKTPNVGVSELISNEKAAKVLKYFLVTDQPAQRPKSGPLNAKFKTREIVLAVYKPKNAAEEAAVKAWLQVAFNIADLLAKPNTLKPEVSRKLVKTRVQTETDLASAYAKEKLEDAPPDETAEERRLAKKRAERATMSDKEIKRLDELEKKREMRKLQKKQGGR